MSLVDRFALCTQCQHEDYVDFLHETVEGHISVRGMTDHEFALSGLDLSSDLGTVLQDLDGFDDFSDASGYIFIEFGKVFEESIEV